MAIINFFKRKPRTKAQTLVEFALVMPILLMIIYGLLETGRLIFLQTTVISAAREAARYGSATGAVGGTTQYKDCDGIKAAATKVDALGAIDPNRISIQYDHGPGTGIFASCSSTVNLKGGDRIIVTVQAEFVPVVGMVPFVSRTYAGGNPLESENIRTVLGRVKVKGSVGSIPPGLTVTINGDGHVDTSDGKITGCRDSCNASYNLADATVVTLTASPDAGTTFLSWGGDCSGTPWTDPCTIIMDTDRVVTADFSSSKRNLFVTTVGTGYVTGDITPLIDCGDIGHLACSQNYDFMAHVELTGNPGPGLHTYWGGACSGTDVPCALDMDSNKIVSVNFGPDGYPVDIAFPGQGTGKVDLSPPSPSGIDNCTAPCEVWYPADTSITLTATAYSGSHPDGWTGCTTSDTTTCTVTLDGPKSVSVMFDTNQKSLTVSLLGYGTGTVTSDVPGIDCTKATSPCSKLFDSDITVVLTAAKDTGMDFTSWGGSCASAGSDPTCTLVMNQIQFVTATFDDPNLKTLLIAKAGAGIGMVTSTSTPPGNPNPIACGSICSAAFPIATQVTLTEAPDSNSEFKGWIGPCAEADPATSPTCTVTMMAGVTVTATFEEIQLDPCIFTQTKPVWNNSEKTVIWKITNTVGGTNPEVKKLFIIWDGGILRNVSIDNITIWSGNQDPVGMDISGNGMKLGAGDHTIVYSYPNPTSIKGYNFNTTIFFVPSNCSPLSTGSWRVE